MLGITGPSPSAAPAPAAPGDVPVSQKTIMGMTSPFVAGPPPPRNAPKPAAAPPQAAGPAVASAPAAPRQSAQAEHAASPNPKRTMLGVAPGPVAAPPSAPPAPTPTPLAKSPAQKTMLGVAPPEPQRGWAAPVAPSSSAGRSEPESVGTASTAPPPPTPAHKVAPKTDRTMLGLPNAPVAVEPPEPAVSPSGRPARAGKPERRQRSFSPPKNARRGTSDAPAAKSSRALAAIVGALVVLGALAGLWLALRGGPDMALRVVQRDEGEMLEVEVPDAAPGAKVRFLGVEQVLKGGVARFPLAADALLLGDNELSIGLVEQGGDVDTSKVRLHVAYRARVDTSGLSQEPPHLDIVIDALPGSKVTVDGTPLTLDPRGRGVRSYPVAPQGGTKLAFSARYRIEPKDASATEGALSLHLPVTSLHIDRPGPSVTTDQATLEVAGEVEPAAEVAIDGQPVKVNEGRFLHRARLPKPGDYTIHVLARSKGKAPRSIDLRVTRVADMTLAAASFQADPALTYAKIAQNPTIYRGQNVAFDGRVYNVEVTGGASHLQMLVRDCPGAQRCPLWVEVPQATEVTADTWVRVLGTIAGEQQFRSERGQVHTVPSVRAQYVLKLAR